MDYHKLYNELPKEPIKWNVNDIEIWLRFIGLSNLYDKFRDLSIDGSCIGSITEEDLRQELGIQSGIIVKKIMLWITRGLRQYDEFMRMQGEGQMREITQKPKLANQPQLLQETSNNNRSIKYSTNKIIAPLFANPSEKQNLPQPTHDEPFESSMMEEQESASMEDKTEYELIIQQCDLPQTSFYSVKEEGAKIGRHSSNQILILDESISRYHAEIKFQNEKFYLKDNGSTTGTFIKIYQKKEVYDGMIVEMGSNQFSVHFTEGKNIKLEIIEGLQQGSCIELPKQSKITIGRKSSNVISFPEDQHLSNHHSSIFYSGEKYYIEDMGTTNGTWERLSLETEASEFFQLEDKMVFKLGASNTYICKIKTAIIHQKIHPNACVICYENDKDCVYMPCKHNTACIRCSKNLKQCPICRVKIQDFVRIYKS